MASGDNRKRRRRKRRPLAGSVWLKLAAVLAVGVVSVSLAVAALTRGSEVSTAGIQTPAGTSAEVSLSPSPPRVAIIGDSYTGGSSMNTEGLTWPSLLVSDGLLELRPQVLAWGGTGYVTTNPEFGDKSFQTNAGDVIENADVVILFGSRNDGTQSYEDIRSAAANTYQRVKDRAPDAYLLVVGPPWVNEAPPLGLQSARDAVRDAAAEAGVQFVDPIQEVWFPAGNQLIGTDGVHPTDAGHRAIADRMRPYLEQALAAA